MLTQVDIKEIRKDFPILATQMNGKPLVYLDNAATSQKPWAVINRVSEYYQSFNANVHRGFYAISEKATFEMEKVRAKIAKFIGAENPSEIIFTSGATESSNMLKYGLSYQLGEGDHILVGGLEHNSHSAPWLNFAEQKNISLEVIPFLENGIFDLESLTSLIRTSTKILAITWVSNFMGTIQPVGEIVKIARAKNPDITIILDAAQGVPYLLTRVGELDVDFLFFSAHKMLGPMGVGVLWGKKEKLETLRPFKLGGGSIDKLEGKHFVLKDLPEFLESGTPNVEGILGFGAALDYLNSISMEEIQAYEKELETYLSEELKKFDSFIELRKRSAPSIAMATGYLEGINSHDAVAYLDAKGIAVRSGIFCSHLIAQQLESPSAIRASFYFYNTREEIDIFLDSLQQIRKVLIC